MQKLIILWGTAVLQEMVLKRQPLFYKIPVILPAGRMPPF